MKNKIYCAVWDLLDGNIELYLFSSFEKVVDDIDEMIFLYDGTCELTDPENNEFTIYNEDKNKVAKVTICTYTLDNSQDYFLLREDW